MCGSDPSLNPPPQTAKKEPTWLQLVARLMDCVELATIKWNGSFGSTSTTVKHEKTEVTNPYMPKVVKDEGGYCLQLTDETHAKWRWSAAKPGWIRCGQGQRTFWPTYNEAQTALYDVLTPGAGKTAYTPQPSSQEAWRKRCFVAAICFHGTSDQPRYRLFFPTKTNGLLCWDGRFKTWRVMPTNEFTWWLSPQEAAKEIESGGIIGPPSHL